MGRQLIVPEMPPLPDLPEAVQTLRDARQRAFVWIYMFNGGNGAAAARAAGYSDVKDAAKVRSCVLLQHDEVQAALQALCTKYLYALAPKAVSRLGSLLSSRNERVALKAVDMTLSRTGFSERTALDVNVSGRVQHDHTSAAVEDLRRMKALGVPRAALEQAFGFTGLSRYEKLLAAADAKVIEAEPADG